MPDARVLKTCFIYGRNFPQNDPNIETTENFQVFFTILGCFLYNFELPCMKWFTNLTITYPGISSRQF